MEYKKPEIEIVVFEAEDVVTASNCTMDNDCPKYSGCEDFIGGEMF